MTENGGARATIWWDPKVGSLRFESNMSHLELIAICRLVEHSLIKQMAAGQGEGRMAEGLIRQPGLAVRKLP